jgi:hypothetical protein
MYSYFNFIVNNWITQVLLLCKFVSLVFRGLIVIFQWSFYYCYLVLVEFLFFFYNFINSWITSLPFPFKFYSLGFQRLGCNFIRVVVTQFWTPRVGDGVYLFWTECRSLAHIRQKIDKSTERNILFFWNLVWAVFCSF